MKYATLLALLFTPLYAQQPVANQDWKSKLVPEVIDTSAFKAMGDLEVTVWASTPHLYNPTNMDIDHKGRVWVAELSLIHI